VNETLTRLNKLISLGSTEDEIDWSKATLSELCDDIEQTHHDFLRAELPRLSEIVDTVVATHSDRHPALAELQETFQQLCDELEPHMKREEEVLFPVIRLMEQSDIPMRPSFETVVNPITRMEDDHSSVELALERLRNLTYGFRIPGDACNTYRVMIEGLRQLEADLHQHIHKENNILFPRAQRLEANRGTTV
jgi:regulator of cell morphogenesis and NO signaling